jgi:NAD(P)H-hydrate epimerase
VQVAVPEPIQATVAIGQICATTVGLPATRDGRFSDRAQERLIDLVGRADVVAIGPGLGRGPAIQRLVAGLLPHLRVPVVIDADAINALATAPREFILPRKAILTPHPGEFARLLGLSTQQVQDQRLELARDYAQRRNTVVVLKGHRSLITDGERVYINSTGNSGMATGGSGDVLTGVIAALLGQKMLPFDAACLGTYLHGKAGDLARDELGELSLIASDLLRYLPEAIRCHAPR